MPLTKFLESIRPVSHRPRITWRSFIYVAAGYLIPVVGQVAFPADPNLTDELLWLVMLGPAFILALHYGLKGAFMALILGTVLFLVVQAVVALNFTPDDWRITLPTYVAYGALAIAVGWLSEELHLYYQRAMTQERLAAIGQMAVTVNHEVNNDLTGIIASGQLLTDPEEEMSPDHRRIVHRMVEAARRIGSDLERITALVEAPVVSYLGDVKMVDLEASSTGRRASPAAKPHP